MDHSVTFARHYARLLWLVLHEPANVDEQKASLRALVTVSKDGAVSMTASGDSLSANASAVPGALSGVRDLARQMGSHGLAEVEFDAGAAAAGILGSARLLAGEAVVGDGGAAALSKLQSGLAVVERQNVELGGAFHADTCAGERDFAAGASALGTHPFFLGR